MSLENQVNQNIVHGLIDLNSTKGKGIIERIKKESLEKGITLKFNDEEYQKALKIAKMQLIYKELGGGRLRVSIVGYKVLQEKEIRFNYV